MTWGRRLTILVPYLWLVAFFVAPFLIVLRISVSETVYAQPPYTPTWDSLDAVLSHLSNPYLGNYAWIFSDDLYLKSFANSLVTAAVSTVIALVIAYPIAYGIARTSPVWRGTLLALVILPFWTSFLIRVYAWIGIFQTEGVRTAIEGVVNPVMMSLGLIDEPAAFFPGQGAVYVGIVYSYLPFMILPLYASLEKLDPALLEAAADLGARPAVSFLRVTLPLSLPGVAAGSFLVFIPTVGEFVIPELLGDSATLMIGRTLWVEFFSNRDWPLASAMAVLLLLVLVVPIVVFQQVAKQART
ncbi:MAG: ABC transporter permease subunit [Pseudomonadota bacterium]